MNDDLYAEINYLRSEYTRLNTLRSQDQATARHAEAVAAAERMYCDNLVAALAEAESAVSLTSWQLRMSLRQRDEARAAYRAASDRLIARHAMLENQTWD